ncbi:hypothetical protein A3K86_06680 [Photobacterium jeanii]|uniref:Outer membrane protein beta-barrel domain-containing protein n=1 Tax=Photobacterium jeanii TaxID=858640 RepID=A0A178KMR2_9GAMM|nr:hypothetical protein [Photobacterium jeanii]OAN18567.1 hypothetical protein A3K86_06680 [Photobacterium jeanii]
MKHSLLTGAALFAGALSPFTHAQDSDVLAQVEREKNNIHWSGLPVFGDKARELGYDLPIPVGFGIYMNTQEVEYVAENDFKLNAHGGALGRLCNVPAVPEIPSRPGNPTNPTNPERPSRPAATSTGGNSCAMAIPAENVGITGKDDSIQLRLDAWVFPFMNVYGLAGYTRGTKDITADLSTIKLENKTVTLPDGIPTTLPLHLEYEAYNLGIGTVLAGQFEVIDGMRPIIVTAVGAMTNSWTTTTDSTIRTSIGALRIGQRYDVPYGKLTLLGGYTYQMIQQNVSGSISLEGTPLSSVAESIDFDVDLKSKESSNMAISAVYDFGDNNEWSLFAEYGFLNWNQFTFSLGRRF